MAGFMTHHDKPGVSCLRIAAWTAGVLLLLLPLLAMQFTSEVNWTAGDFLFAAILIFGSLGLLELVARKRGSLTYRVASAAAVGATFLLTWINAAVGITDSAADTLFLLVPVIALTGAVMARFRPAGMAKAMLVAAIATALIGLFALAAGMVPEYNSAFEILGLSGFFAALWAVSALLFHVAARRA